MQSFFTIPPRATPILFALMVMVIQHLITEKELSLWESLKLITPSVCVFFVVLSVFKVTATTVAESAGKKGEIPENQFEKTLRIIHQVEPAIPKPEEKKPGRLSITDPIIAVWKQQDEQRALIEAEAKAEAAKLKEQRMKAKEGKILEMRSGGEKRALRKPEPKPQQLVCSYDHDAVEKTIAVLKTEIESLKTTARERDSEFKRQLENVKDDLRGTIRRMEKSFNLTVQEMEVRFNEKIDILARAPPPSVEENILARLDAPAQVQASVEKVVVPSQEVPTVETAIKVTASTGSRGVNGRAAPRKTSQPKPRRRGMAWVDKYGLPTPEQVSESVVYLPPPGRAEIVSRDTSLDVEQQPVEAIAHEEPMASAEAPAEVVEITFEDLPQEAASEEPMDTVEAPVSVVEIRSEDLPQEAASEEPMETVEAPAEVVEISFGDLPQEAASDNHGAPLRDNELEMAEVEISTPELVAMLNAAMDELKDEDMPLLESPPQPTPQIPELAGLSEFLNFLSNFDDAPVGVVTQEDLEPTVPVSNQVSGSLVTQDPLNLTPSTWTDGEYENAYTDDLQGDDSLVSRAETSDDPLNEVTVFDWQAYQTDQAMIGALSSTTAPELNKFTDWLEDLHPMPPAQEYSLAEYHPNEDANPQISLGNTSSQAEAFPERRKAVPRYRGRKIQAENGRQLAIPQESFASQGTGSSTERQGAGGSRLEEGLTKGVVADGRKRGAEDEEEPETGEVVLEKRGRRGEVQEEVEALQAEPNFDSARVNLQKELNKTVTPLQANAMQQSVEGARRRGMEVDQNGFFKLGDPRNKPRRRF